MLLLTLESVHRQPFIVASAIAAVAWDTADVHVASQDPAESPDMPAARQDFYSSKAIMQIDAEILLLMQGSTVFSFATTFHDTMLRYVYLRRALQGRASIDEVCPCKVLFRYQVSWPVLKESKPAVSAKHSICFALMP